jgi:hypothetical protein
MIIEAAKGGHTQVVKLLLEYPNRVLMNGSPEIEQLPEPHLKKKKLSFVEDHVRNTPAKFFL